ncbi:2644_t:CDS:2 [Ambispora gerdemannii]|uniref:Leucine carboxyl methyltransferase 1 n=1 Tax=Ambispora gerdemannii TaxID=144530 RepID=A0A9N8WPV7_9GLOM|nr:2644_t:CDS:2 [Ambispora gerdemannii]
MDSLTLDNAIRGTNEDAVTSKLSAVTTGYIQDSYVKYFVKKPSRRPPIINRGLKKALASSYVRYAGLDTLIKKFLEAGIGMDHSKDEQTKNNPKIKKQIVSLGAGSDTRYFNSKSKKLLDGLYKYFEIDYPEVTAKKVAVIRKNKQLSELFEGNAKLGLGGTELYASDYCLLSGDLKDFVETIIPRMEEQGFDKSLPTLFLSECVLIYMEQQYSDKIIQWVGDNMQTALFVVYEQILPNDIFGITMLQNLRLRNIELRGIHAYPDLKSQKQRFLTRGWTFAEAVDINQIHDHHIDPKEMIRISELELLDELEEWRLLSAHYCIAWAYSAKDESKKALFEQVRFINYKIK